MVLAIIFMYGFHLEKNTAKRGEIGVLQIGCFRGLFIKFEVK